MIDLFGAASVLLCRIDDTDYLAVRAVYAVQGEQPPALYCLESEWPTTPMARIAALQRKVAQLEAELEALKRDEMPETPAQNQARMFQAQADLLNGGAKPGPCPDCGKADLKNVRALQMHRQRAHQGMIAGRPQPQQFVEELGWRCAAKGCTGAFTRDLHDTAFCTHHAAPRTNGHAAEVAP